MGETLPLLLTLVVLFGAAVFLAAAEASLLRVRRVAVEVRADAGDRRAARVARLLGDLPRVMNTVLLVVLLVQIGAATVTGLLAERHFGNLGITVASVALTVVMFVYAEAIPKTYAVRSPLRVAMAVSGPVALLALLLRPIVSVLVAFADLQAPGRGIAGPVGVSEEELRRLAAQAERAGEIASEDLELIERAFRLGDAGLDVILVPRTEVVAVAADASVDEALEVAIGSGHRRIPVHSGDLDHITGVVLLKDLVAAAAERQAEMAGDLARPVLVVPRSKRVIALLREMQHQGLHFAVAVDEHGGTAGIVTIEDVVEELVGEVADEGEDRSTAIRQAGPGHWVVDAGAPVAELAEALGTELPEGEWRTTGGLVNSLAGRIPRPGDEFDLDGFRVRVLVSTRRRVVMVEVLEASGRSAG